MTPLADRSTGEQWPELEPCACKSGPVTERVHSVRGDRWRAECFACYRSVEGRTRAEAAAAWNAMQRVARGVDVVTIEFPDAESRHRWDHMGDNPCDDKACAICYVQEGEP